MKFNFDLFGIKARRKERETHRLAEAQTERQQYQERKRKIDAYLDEFIKNKSAKEMKAYDKNMKKADEKNGTCPMCHSKNVVHKVVRTKGDIHGGGSSRSFSSGGLFNHYSSSGSDWRLDGSLDTLPVNKCNDCGNEWNIEKAEKPEYFDPFQRSAWIYYDIKKYLEIDFDPYSKKKMYNSLEEKQAAFIENASSHFYYEEYRKLPRYVLDYVVRYGGKFDYSPNEAFGFSRDNDEYSYIMPDAIFDILKRLLKWKGDK